MTNPSQRPSAVRIPRHFESFYRDQYSRVVAVCYALSGSQAAAEDVAQEAFIRAHRDWEMIGRYERPDAWVRRVATNLAFSRFRRLKAESRAVLRLAGNRQEITFDMTESDDELWSKVRALPRRQAQVVALHYVEDRAIADIANVLGIAEGSVKPALPSEAPATALGWSRGFFVSKEKPRMVSSWLFRICRVFGGRKWL